MVGVCAVFRMSRNAARRLGGAWTLMYTKEGAARMAGTKLLLAGWPPISGSPPMSVSVVTPLGMCTRPGAGNDRFRKYSNHFGDWSFPVFPVWVPLHSPRWLAQAHQLLRQSITCKLLESLGSLESLESRFVPNDDLETRPAYQLRVLAAATPTAAYAARHHCISEGGGSLRLFL